MSEENTENATPETPEKEAEVEVSAKPVAPGNDGSGEVQTAKDGDGSSVKSEDVSQPGGNGNSSGYERRGGGYGSYDRDRPRRMTDDEKLKRYKKQSEERLLDIKRSKEAKIGKRRGR